MNVINVLNRYRRRELSQNEVVQILSNYDGPDLHQARMLQILFSGDLTNERHTSLCLSEIYREYSPINDSIQEFFQHNLNPPYPRYLVLAFPFTNRSVQMCYQENGENIFITSYSDTEVLSRLRDVSSRHAYSFGYLVVEGIRGLRLVDNRDANLVLIRGTNRSIDLERFTPYDTDREIEI